MPPLTRALLFPPCARRLSLTPSLQVETRLYQLIAQVKQIANEQSYQRVCPFLQYACNALRILMQAREANFRELSESTNARVLWWSIGQVHLPSRRL